MSEAENNTVECPVVNRAQEAVANGVNFLNGLPPMPANYNNPVESVEDPFNLDNLRYREPVTIETQNKKINLVPSAVRDFVTRINALPDDSKKTFVIGIGTGGTISMAPKEEGGPLVSELDFGSIMQKTDPRLKDEFEVEGIDAFSTDSSQLEIDDVGDLAISMCYIWQEMKPSLRRRFGGFLIVHGTDTMPKSGNHLEMMLGKNLPFNIVHTGAQKPINEKINDAQPNVKNALFMLRMLRNNNCAESVTVMGGKGILTAGMTKVSDHHAKAMATHMHRDVIDFDALPDPDTHKLPEWLREKPGHKQFNPVVYRGPNRVGQLEAEMQEDPRAIIASIRLAARKAILLVTYGANTYDYKAVRIIAEEAEEQGIPVFAVSPVNADPKLDVYEAGAELSRAGVTPLYMTLHAARAKLMAAFAKFGNDTKAVTEFMGDNFVGEIPTKINRRDLAA
ncbi:MAG: asparaginase domain-containing protein [Candidatus Gracilibacteria bacterium]|jgi:L-asparaginase/Glu-tRNA(Gln) amidotransferase subunit D